MPGLLFLIVQGFDIYGEGTTNSRSNGIVIRGENGEDDPFDIYPIAEPNPTGGMVSLAHIFGDFGSTGLPDDQLKANGIIPMGFGELQSVDRV